MKSDYEQRKSNRIARYQGLAEKNAELSEHQSEQARKLASVIPFGQPILIGHHSESRDRNYRNKIQKLHEKSWESEEKSKYYEGKAEAAESNLAISSDDPRALEKLKEHLKDMERIQAFMKAANKVIRNGNYTEEEKLKILAPYNMSDGVMDPVIKQNQGFEGFSLSNNSQSIARIRKRIAYLESLAKVTSHEITINGVRIFMNVEANRLQLFFPGKPEDSTRQLLKQNGFRWSPNEGAWQRHICNIAVYYAKEIAQQVTPAV